MSAIASAVDPISFQIPPGVANALQVGPDFDLRIAVADIAQEFSVVGPEFTIVSSQFSDILTDLHPPPPSVLRRRRLRRCHNATCHQRSAQHKFHDTVSFLHGSFLSSH
jgi:hypothetical protein